jgi:uncharacterized damage-inducible protein DinB
LGASDRGQEEENRIITERPVAAPEAETLHGFLDAQRDLILWKIEGLDDEQLRRRMTPTGMSLLGLVKHLAYVEDGWFRQTFAGKEPSPDLPWNEDDPAMDWRIEPHETTDEILSFYKNAVDESRAIARAADLEQLSAVKTGRRGHVSMRWILMHMIEEVSRHLGHADIMRESIDGAVGDYPGGTPVVAP